MGYGTPGPAPPPLGTVPTYPAYPEYRAPHIGHGKHLCDLAERGEISLEQMKALVKDPKYICRKCGRAAAKEENLCEPVPI